MLDKLYAKKIKVTLEGSRELVVNYKTKVDEIIEQAEYPSKISEIMAVRVNNEVRTLDYEIVTDTKLEHVTYNSNDGYRIYNRTLRFILYMALCKLYPKYKVEYSNNMNNDSYFICKEAFTEEMANNIREEMQNIIDRNSQIVRRAVPSEEAKIIYETMQNKDYINMMGSELKSYVTLFFCETVANHMSGVLAPRTGFIKGFDIKPYRKGFVLVAPNRDNINVMPKEITKNKLYDIYEEFEEYNTKINVESVRQLNDKVINKDIGTIIRTSEILHEKQILKLTQKIEEKEEIKMLLIAGPSSSGKTTFAQKLGDNLKLIGYNPIIISMDNYYRERKENYNKETGEYDYESVNSLDIELFNDHMKKLTSGESVNIPRYDFGKGSKSYSDKKLKLEKKDIMLVEGIHALNDEMTKQVEAKYKFKIYMAPITTLNLDSYTKVSSTDTRMLRRIVRDYATRSVKVEETLEMWEKIRKGEEKNIYPFTDSADYIFNSSLIYEMGVIRTFAEPLLLQVKNTSKYFSEARRLYEFLSNFLPVETKEIP
ncbi:MAG: hypothetical protein PHR25_03030, partial [Clostridia bacterium]|nr:hypothetical protein [Clostridia bacterium]